MSAFRIFRRLSELLDVLISSPADGDVIAYDAGSSKWKNSAAAGGGGGAPTNATYITQTANGTLSNEQPLASLSTGLMKVTTTTGVISTAVEGTDYYGVGGTDVAVADGGTGASTASSARSNLGLAIGTDVEAHDADLTTIAGLSPTNDDVLQRKVGAWTNRSLAQLMTDLAALGTTFQPLDSDLTAIAALTTTSYGRALLSLANAAAADFLIKASNLSDLADAPTARTNLGLGSVATLSSIAESNLTTSDVATANVTSTKHGFAPKSGADATTFLNGATTPAYAQVKDSDLSTSDVTTNNVSSTKHGFAPKSPASATQFLNGAATPAFAQVKDSDLAFTDITTNNTSTSNHGFAPKLDNNAAHFLNGQGGWTSPTASADPTDANLVIGLEAFL